MAGQNSTQASQTASRRDFIKASSALMAGGTVTGSIQAARSVHPSGSDLIKIGLIGCGSRGSGAVADALRAGGNVKLIAMGDTFEDQLRRSVRGLKSRLGDRIDVPQERQFFGFDAYRQVLATGCDLVILATPPGFRPLHFEAAVQAGKHVFLERPVAVDPPGVRRVLAATEEARNKNLLVQVGFQRRHEAKYIQTIQAIHDGAIGEIILARAYWNGQPPRVRPRQPEWCELEYQLRNWYYFNWAGGDQIVEQHSQNLDVINWVMQGHPVKGQGQGGCQVRSGPDCGETFDHHFVEFTYADGVTLLSQCRRTPNCWNSVAEYVHGTKGYADICGGKIYDRSGQRIHSFDRLGADGHGGSNGHACEQVDLFRELRAGNRPNEGVPGALSTMTAILGRMATYSGAQLTWDQALHSQLAIAPVDELTSWDAEPWVKPDGDERYALPVPGVTRFA